jgi:hypothetical protein
MTCRELRERSREQERLDWIRVGPVKKFSTLRAIGPPRHYERTLFGSMTGIGQSDASTRVHSDCSLWDI